MPYRLHTRHRLLLLSAASSTLALVPPAHAGGLTFTYSADQGAYGMAFALGESAVEPALGPVTLEGRATFRPSGRSFRITLDDVAVPDGTRVPVTVWHGVGEQRRSTEHCVPIGKPYTVSVPAQVEITLYVEGASLYPWQPCGAPATVGTGEITWG